jgi:hypothetical protein
MSDAFTNEVSFAGEVTNMARPEVMEYEINVKVAGKQLEFLESKAEELGISKEELAKLYIEKAIDAESQKKRFSIMGIVSDGRITDEDIDKGIGEWNRIGEAESQ